MIQVTIKQPLHGAYSSKNRLILCQLFGQRLDVVEHDKFYYSFMAAMADQSQIKVLVHKQDCRVD
jgi:hypothetical protein